MTTYIGLTIAEAIKFAEDFEKLNVLLSS